MCAAPRFGFGGAELGRTAFFQGILRDGDQSMGRCFFGGQIWFYIMASKFYVEISISYYKL